MFEKTVMTLAAAAAIAAAAAVAVVALAFAFYQLLLPHVGPAGAAAALALVVVVVLGVLGLLAAMRAGAGRHHPPQPGPADMGLVEKIIDIVRDRPMLSAGAALAAGIFALRNPAFMSALVKGFMETTTRRD